MARVAAIIIATERRKALVLERVLPSVLSQGFDDVILVGDWFWTTGEQPAGCRYFCVEPLLHNTLDALIKRDVGALATYCEILAYTCDDHILAPTFLATLREVIDEEWDVIVPNRVCRVQPAMVNALNTSVEFLPGENIVALNNGERDGYCGGHGGVFRRDVIRRRPWAAQSHTPYWDARASFSQRLDGARFVWHPRAGIAIEDIEPNAQPWK